MFGLSVSDLNAVSNDSDDCYEDYEVWQENIESVECFLACRTQWKLLSSHVGKPVVLGLEYAGVILMLRSMKMKNWREVFADIQVMEWAALEVLNA